MVDDAAFMDRNIDIARFLEFVQNFKPTTTALALHWIPRISQQLQFAKHKARHDKRPAQETGLAKIRDAPIDNDVRIDNDRLLLRRLAAETHVWNDQRELVAIAAH